VNAVLAVIGASAVDLGPGSRVWRRPVPGYREDASTVLVSPNVIMIW